MKNKAPQLAIGGLIAASFSSLLAAQATQKPLTVFNTVEVSASRIEQTAQKDTRSIDSINRDQLDEIQPTSVADALKFEANVTMAGGPIAGNQSVNIRGLEGNKVLQVIDGSRVNTNFSHRPSYFLDPALLKSINVVKGPVSSLWGSGAIAGVVSQQTLSADDLIKTEGTPGGLIKAGFNNNGDKLTATAAIAGKNNAFSWLAAASYLDSDTMEQGNGDTLFGAETENLTALVKLDWQLNDSSRIGLNYRTADTDGHPPVVGSAEEQLNDADNLIDRETTDEHISLNYHYNPASKWLQLDANLYQNDTRIEERNLNDGKDISDIETLGFSLTNQAVFGQLNLLAGVDGYEDTLNTDRPDNGDGRPNPPDNAKTTTVGAFVYGDYAITSSVVLEAGVRYDSFESKAAGFDNSDEAALSPAIAARWQASEWAALSLRYDEAFRAPDVYELFMDGIHFSFYPGGPSNIFVANPELDPETSNNIELKSEFSFSDIIGQDKVVIVASVFENKVDDFIQLSVNVPEDMPFTCFIPGMGTGCAGTSTSENIAKAQLQGFEVAASYQLDALTASLSYGQTRGKDEDTDEYLAGIPADKWVATLDYGFWSIDTKVGVKAIKTSNQDKTPSDDTQGPYKGITTVDFYASWEPSQKSLEGVKIDLNVANAFDQNYRNAWASVYQPGRSVKISAQYRF
ncbi:TonB-dependent hemoglobin/transferrin/lactoferrin family receptor [Oceanicoccus sp. KOV_DT_Chl]|uniref:TonB-dependent hemoglobin/transferrin/lactoferrin family receptor n=1 Tax=Oceanicoccus sp. KOV_DT_Chl TaxID=1904639 RepID=UPI000C79E22F|nr:TonB-dependent hemoglobin/transferrin/lactoferrin family receptor [Oceanicoccus sp. KOV_DT_Chl]